MFSVRIVGIEGVGERAIRVMETRRRSGSSVAVILCEIQYNGNEVGKIGMHGGRRLLDEVFVLVGLGFCCRHRFECLDWYYPGQVVECLLERMIVEWVEKAFGCKEAAELYRLHAFMLEKRACELMSDSKVEPSRSVLCRSAATLAIRCEMWGEAIRLAELGLAGNPPEEIKSELVEVRNVAVAATQGKENMK